MISDAGSVKVQFGHYNISVDAAPAGDLHRWQPLLTISSLNTSPKLANSQAFSGLPPKFDSREDAMWHAWWYALRLIRGVEPGLEL